MKIKLDLTLDQVNLALTALSNLPFNQVVDIIGTIREQAENQVREANKQNEHSASNTE